MSGCFWPARGFRSPPGRGRCLVFCALRNYTAGGDAGIGHFDRKQKEKALALLAALLLFFALRNTVPALEPAAGFLRAYLLAGILSAWYISLLRRLLRGGAAPVSFGDRGAAAILAGGPKQQIYAVCIALDGRPLLLVPSAGRCAARAGSGNPGNGCSCAPRTGRWRCRACW